MYRRRDAMHTLLTAAYNGSQKLEFAALGVAAPGVLVSKYCPPFPHLVTRRGVAGMWSALLLPRRRVPMASRSTEGLCMYLEEGCVHARGHPRHIRAPDQIFLSADAKARRASDSGGRRSLPWPVAQGSSPRPRYREARAVGTGESGDAETRALASLSLRPG